MKKVWIIVLVSMIMISCQQDRQDNAVVSGRFIGSSVETARVMELKTQRIIPVDSVLTDNKGRFVMRFLPEETGFYLFSVADRDPLSLVIGAGDSIKLVLDTTDIYIDYEIEGNKSSRMLMKYHRKTGKTKQIIDSLRNVLFENQGQPDFADIKFAIDATLHITLEQHREYAEQLIRDNPGELASLLLINKTIAGQPVFNPEEDTAIYFLVEDSLQERFPDNSHVKEHSRRMGRIREMIQAAELAESRVGIGKKVPPMKLPGINDEPVSIASLKGNPVILFFWASWSPESRADMQLLKQFYKKHQDSGLEVYAVSLDHNQRFWKAAVKTEALRWVNVCDVAGMQGPTAKLFNLTGRLPFYYLLDESGTIVNKTADFSVLEKSVQDLFNQKL